MTASELTERLLVKLAAEEFLIDEAALLDSWRLDEWLALFTDDCHYVVPSTDRPDGDPATDLTLVDDDHERLYWRVHRLKSRHAHREYPYSRTRRVVSNVRVVDHDDAAITVTSTLVVYRYRHGRQDQFVGHATHRLIRTEAGLRIQMRRTELDLERLSPNGAISMIF